MLYELDEEQKVELNKIINRHKARLLTKLEEANCPGLYHDAVTDELDWLRSDLNKIGDDDGYEG